MHKLNTIVTGLLLITTLTLGWRIYTQPQVGYVHQERLVNEFEGMKEATELYAQKLEGWNKALDSLQFDYQHQLKKYIADSISMSSNEKIKGKNNIKLLYENVYAVKNKIEQQAVENDTKMTNAVLNQVHELVAKYAQSNGYDVIVSNTSQQNLEYINTDVDITDQVLDYINNHYEGN